MVGIIDSIAFTASLVAAQLDMADTLLIEVRSYTFDQLGFVLERATLCVQPLAFCMARAHPKKFFSARPSLGGVIAGDFG